MSEAKKVVLLDRDCVAMLVPSGARIMIQKDTEVTVTQSLGGSITVNLYGNLARIDTKDADALGMVIENPLTQLAADAPVEEKVWAQLRSVYDPEIPVNVVDLGLIYHCDVQKQANGHYFVAIDMTLTAPGCGMGPVIAADVRNKCLEVTEVEACEVELVFDPPWTQERMSEEAKLELGMF